MRQIQFKIIQGVAKPTTKKIVIDTVGQIPIIGGITGPILKPFNLKVDIIRHLIAIRISVKEAIEFGGEYYYCPLNLRNYDSVIVAEPEGSGIKPMEPIGPSHEPMTPLDPSHRPMTPLEPSHRPMEPIGPSTPVEPMTPLEPSHRPMEPLEPAVPVEPESPEEGNEVEEGQPQQRTNEKRRKRK